MIVSELVSVLGFKVDTDGVRQFDNLMNQLSKRVDAFTTGIGISIGNKIADIAMDLGKSIVAGLAGIPKAGDEMSSAIQKIKSILGDNAEAGNEAVGVYEKLYQASLTTGIGANASAQAFTQLHLAMADMKRPASDTVDFLTGVQAAGVVAGQSTQDVTEAIRQLGQAFGSSKLQGDELKILSERMPRFLREVQKELGLTSAQFREMGTKGKLTPEILTDPMMKVGKRFFDEMLRMPVSMSRSFAILKLVVERFSADLDRALGLSKGIAAAVQFLSRTIEGLRSRISVIGDMVKALGGLQEIARFVVIGLAAFFAPSIIAGFETLTAAIIALGRSFLMTIAPIVAVALVVEDFVSWVEGRSTIFGDLFGDFNEAVAPIRPALEAVKTWFEENLAVGPFIENTKRELRDLSEFFATAFNFGDIFENTKREFLGIKEWLEKNFDFNDIVEKAKNVFEDFRKFVSDPWEYTKDKINVAIDAIKPKIESFIASAALIMEAFRPLADFFTGIFELIGNKLSAFYDKVVGVLGGIRGAIGGLIGMIPGLSSSAEGAGAAGNEGRGAAGNAVSGPADATINPDVARRLSGMLDGLAPVPDVTGRVTSGPINTNQQQNNNINNNIAITAPAGDAASIAAGVNSSLGQATDNMTTRLGGSLALGLGISTPRVEAPAIP